MCARGPPVAEAPAHSASASASAIASPDPIVRERPALAAFPRAMGRV